MSNQTKAALHILQWMSDMEGRVEGCDGAINVAKAWEERELQKKAQAYKRLVKAVNCIPALSPRERMSKFVAYGLRAAVHKQLEKRKNGVGVSVLPWMDVGLLSDVDLEGGDWGAEVADAYIAAIESAEPFECILGWVFNELAGSGQKKRDCQDFTPWALAQGAMRFLPRGLGDGCQEPLFNDFTCGAGTLLLARVHALLWSQSNDPHALMDLVVSANDRDPLCAAMTALQLLINQLVWKRPIGAVHVECKDVIAQRHLLVPVFVSECREDCPFELVRDDL